MSLFCTLSISSLQRSGSILWIYKMRLEKLFWIRKIDLLMTELAEDQRSGFSNEDRLGVGERIQGRKGLIRGGGKMRRITPAEWEWGFLCGTSSNMLRKCPVKCLSKHAQPFPLNYVDSTFPQSCKKNSLWGVTAQEGSTVLMLETESRAGRDNFPRTKQKKAVLTSEAPHGSFVSSFGPFCDRQRW